MVLVYSGGCFYFLLLFRIINHYKTKNMNKPDDIDPPVKSEETAGASDEVD